MDPQQTAQYGLTRLTERAGKLRAGGLEPLAYTGPAALECLARC